MLPFPVGPNYNNFYNSRKYYRYIPSQRVQYDDPGQPAGFQVKQGLPVSCLGVDHFQLPPLSVGPIQVASNPVESKTL